jgi:predicted O-methyltransferase YrrM
VSEIKARTRKFRRFVAWTCLRIFTPKCYEFVKDSFDEFPRPSTKIIHRTYGEKPLIGVEIGTGFGENALSLLHELSIERLYCIDPYVRYLDGGLRNTIIKYQQSSEYTLKTLSKFKNVTFIRKFSSEACKEIPENVDFVYVDGNHGYDYVLADLRDYYPLIHEKGIIAGHDVLWSSVHKALDDFCRENMIRRFVLPPDWIIIK